MSRPKKPPVVIETEAVPPKRAVGRPRKSEAFGVIDLDTRMKHLAERAKAKKRISVDYKVSDVEAFIALAEKWGEDLTVVIRACGAKGREYFEEWASNGSLRSPFEAGHWTPKPPSHYDPVGNQAPPVPRQQPFDDTRGYNGAIGGPAPAHPYQVAHQYVEELTEVGWGEGGVPPGLPSGGSEEVVRGGVSRAHVPPVRSTYRTMPKAAPAPMPTAELLAPEPLAAPLAVGEMEPATEIEDEAEMYEMGQPTEVTA